MSLFGDKFKTHSEEILLKVSWYQKYLIFLPFPPLQAMSSEESFTVLAAGHFDLSKRQRNYLY